MPVRFLTEEEYAHTKVSFREVQRGKPRYRYFGETREDGHWYERAKPIRMTSTWKELQKEYDLRNRSKYDPRTIYFIIDKDKL